MVKTQNYQNGQIYQIVDNGFNLCYIGSTIDKLSNRFNSHKAKYKKYKQFGIGANTSVYELFDKYGVENCKIIWIEDYPCSSKKELEAREGHHQKNNTCLNKNRAGRSRKEWEEDNKDQICIQQRNWRENNKTHLQQHKKQHYEQNREHYNLLAKQWRENNKEYKNECDKRYREKHKETLREKEKEPFNCVCGATVQRTEKARHCKTQKHQEWLKQQEPEIEPQLEELD